MPKEKLNVLLEGGVNRISFGVQTFRDELLEKIGRKHTREDAFVAIRRSAGSGLQKYKCRYYLCSAGTDDRRCKRNVRYCFYAWCTTFLGIFINVEPKTVFYNLMNKGN